MKSGSLIVKHHNPWRRPVIGLIAVIIAFVGGWGLYSWGQHNAGFNSISAAEENMAMQQAIAELERQKLELRDKLALSEQSKLVDKQAYTDVNNNIQALQEEILELREEVSFYRGIVSPAESSAGLHIERFKIAKTGKDRLYHYSLVLTQVLKNQRTIRGKATLYFEGLQDGAPSKIPLRAVSSSRENSFNFKFRYFQKFEGDVLLPAGFIPRSVNVEVDPSRKKTVVKSFDWPEWSAESVAAVGSTDSNAEAE